jgi:hypothetical protein
VVDGSRDWYRHQQSRRHAKPVTSLAKSYIAPTRRCAAVALFLVDERDVGPGFDRTADARRDSDPKSNAQERIAAAGALGILKHLPAPKSILTYFTVRPSQLGGKRNRAIPPARDACFSRGLGTGRRSQRLP